jgi:hypothetical protein
MLDTKTPVISQGTKLTKPITAAQAVVIANKRFSNLASTGILGSKKPAGPPIDLNHVSIALRFLAQCRKSKVPAIHSHDLSGNIGVSVGAVIVAAHALQFDARGWMGTRMFFPGAMIGVNAADVRRLVMITAK